MGASFTKIYFDGISTAYDVIVDNAEIKQLPRQCNRLVENSSFQDGARFWHLTERNRAKLNLYSPGAGGDSDFALRVYNRDHTWRGIMQRRKQYTLCNSLFHFISLCFTSLTSTCHHSLLALQLTKNVLCLGKSIPLKPSLECSMLPLGRE